MIRELALKNRSYRRFYGEKKIDEKTLRELVDIARNTPSAANRQPLQYRLVCDDETKGSSGVELAVKLAEQQKLSIVQICPRTGIVKRNYTKSVLPGF